MPPSSNAAKAMSRRDHKIRVHRRDVRRAAGDFMPGARIAAVVIEAGVRDVAI